VCLLSWVGLLIVAPLLLPEYDFGGNVAHGNSSTSTSTSGTGDGDSKSAPAVSAGMGEGFETKSSARLVPLGADAGGLWKTVPVILTVRVPALSVSAADCIALLRLTAGMKATIMATSPKSSKNPYSLTCSPSITNALFVLLAALQLRGGTQTLEQARRSETPLREKRTTVPLCADRASFLLRFIRQTFKLQLNWVRRVELEFAQPKHFVQLDSITAPANSTARSSVSNTQGPRPICFAQLLSAFVLPNIGFRAHDPLVVLSCAVPIRG
jgi:hypothetical protein